MSRLRIVEAENILILYQQLTSRWTVNRRDHVQQRGLSDPESPISARNSPVAMSIETSSRAFTSNASRLKILLTLRA
jgi:hypothetical protein